MSEADLATLDRDALIALVLKQAAAIDALRAEVESLKRFVERPERPRDARPTGGPFKRRESPRFEDLFEPGIDVPDDQPGCPRRGGELVLDRVDDASITDLPEVVKPRVRLFRVAVHRCKRCGATARGRHPDLADDQRGATAHRLGPRLLAAACHLHYGLGAPVRKLPDTLQILTGATLTQGAITRAALRQARAAVGATYQNLCDSVADAPFVHTDDAGWRVGGAPAWLMVFGTDSATVYQVREQHRNEEVRERIPADYQGTMITDRASVYDAEAFAAVKKPKSLAHVQRSLKEVADKKTGPARRFANELKALLKQASALWRGRWAGPPVEDFAARVRRLKWDVRWHLRPRRLTDPDNQRLLDGLGRCNAEGSLLRFLDDP